MTRAARRPPRRSEHGVRIGLRARLRLRLPHPHRAAGFDLRDLAAEALDGVGGRPGRLLITVLGTVVGIAALVLTIGLGQTAGGQVAAHFDTVAATHVEASPKEVPGADGQSRAGAALPFDAVDRVAGLAGVEAAALFGEVDLGDQTITAVPFVDPSAPEAGSPRLFAASGDLLGAVGGVLSRGRAFDLGHERRADRVVVLGADAAETLGVNDVAAQPSVFIGGHAYTVIGILDEVATQSGLLGSAVIPFPAARRDFPTAAADVLALWIAVGAAPTVTHQVPIALDSAQPENYTVAAPPSSTVLEGQVQDDLDLVFLAIGLITLLAGGLGIANVTLLSVSERTGEIGLRRALGATRGQIAAQFILESLVVGLLGGVIGAAIGVFAVVAASAWRGWTPVLDLTLTLGSALVGGLVGLLAGAYPAAKAARTLVDQGVDAVLATLGANGAVLVTAGGAWHATPPPTEVVSTVGAGDSSLFGYLLGEIQNRPPAQRLALAVAYGSAAAGLPGTTIPHPTQVRSELVSVRDLRPTLGD